MAEGLGRRGAFAAAGQAPGGDAGGEQQSARDGGAAHPGVESGQGGCREFPGELDGDDTGPGQARGEPVEEQPGQRQEQRGGGHGGRGGAGGVPQIGGPAGVVGGQQPQAGAGAEPGPQGQIAAARKGARQGGGRGCQRQGGGRGP